MTKGGKIREGGIIGRKGERGRAVLSENWGLATISRTYPGKNLKGVCARERRLGGRKGQ